MDVTTGGQRLDLHPRRWWRHGGTKEAKQTTYRGKRKKGVSRGGKEFAESPPKPRGGGGQSSKSFGKGNPHRRGKITPPKTGAPSQRHARRGEVAAYKAAGRKEDSIEVDGGEKKNTERGGKFFIVVENAPPPAEKISEPTISLHTKNRIYAISKRRGGVTYRYGGVN